MKRPPKLTPEQQAYENGYDEQIRLGLEDIGAGRVVSHDEAVKHWDTQFRKLEKPGGMGFAIAQPILRLLIPLSATGQREPVGVDACGGLSAEVVARLMQDADHANLGGIDPVNHDVGEFSQNALPRASLSGSMGDDPFRDAINGFVDGLKGLSRDQRPCCFFIELGNARDVRLRHQGDFKPPLGHASLPACS